ncbi:NADH-quinone oxidoreductase subunit H [Mycobacterium antarcticum]|uniref:complex I subunit 1 family protein n=1 Tax=unclassified Mycolicibacterium TaxID=2636767 RepID=UPI0023A74445|nr:MULTISPECIES: complex I subunit 1 family protein [unclassified Mycolicibacterium]BDX32311.1 NADH-quinone oxidoreductase subunit H [Mycolicibacterium sp. TUM20985]GLP84143.1 NADH-quinone oxidoreductase subunit H [Mycolicibacterium sp. TUM20984]
MADGVLTTVSGGWAIGAAALLALLMVFAATVNGVLAARAEGQLGGGFIRPLAETARLMRQRRRTTLEADRPLWRVGGAGLVVAALMMTAVVPLGTWTLLDLDVGVVWFNAMDVLVWSFVWLVGWGPNSVHSMVGGYRFLAHGLAYELPLMFALVAPAIAAGSLRVGDIGAAQHGLWFAVWMPVAFAGYCLGVIAFSVWGPFSPALGPDIAGGVAAELSGVDRLVFEAGRYGLLAAGAAFAVPMFLGGGSGPLLPDWCWVLVKTMALLAAFVWLRRRLPALRPDKFMEVGWLVLLPAVVLQDFVVAVIAVWSN